MEEDEDLRVCATGRPGSNPLWERREHAYPNGRHIKTVRFPASDVDTQTERLQENTATSTSCFNSPRKVSVVSNKSIENETYGHQNSWHDRSNDLRLNHNTNPPNLIPAPTMALINAGCERRDVGHVEKMNKKEEAPKKVWLTALPAGMERTISFNASPMNGKKYRKRLRKALTERLDDAESMLNCKILRADDSRCSSNGKETGGNSGNSDIEVEFLSSNSTIALPGLSDLKEARPNPQHVDKNNFAKASTISEEARLSNIKFQATMKLNKLHRQFNYLNNQLNILSKPGADKLSKERLDQLYKTRQLQRKITDQIKCLEDTLKTTENLHRAEAAINFGSRSVKDKTLPICDSNSTPRNIYYDGGDHICKFCSELFTEVESLLAHVYDTHVNFFSSLSSENRPWAEPQTQLEENRNYLRRPFKGCEFLFPCQGFFCDLCKINVSDETIAKNHLESELHNKNYARYCELNPNYESEMEDDLNRTKNMKERIIELQSFSTDNFKSSNIQVFDTPLPLTSAVESSNDAFELIWLSDSEEDIDERFEMEEFAYITDHDGSNDVDLLEDQCLKSVTT